MCFVNHIFLYSLSWVSRIEAYLMLKKLLLELQWKSPSFVILPRNSNRPWRTVPPSSWTVLPAVACLQPGLLTGTLWSVAVNINTLPKHLFDICWVGSKSLAGVLGDLASVFWCYSILKNGINLHWFRQIHTTLQQSYSRASGALKTWKKHWIWKIASKGLKTVEFCYSCLEKHWKLQFSIIIFCHFKLSVASWVLCHFEPWKFK